MGRSGQGGACLASSSLPSNMDSLERRETRAGSLSSFEMAAWQSHAACEFLSGLTLRSQADVSREQQLSAGARELDDGGSALDAAAAPGALSLDDAQSPSVAGEGGGAGLLSKEGAKIIRADVEASKRVIKSYRLMLRFYGLQLADEKTGQVDRLADEPLYTERMDNLNGSAHNWLRVSRIITSLGEARAVAG